MTPILEVHNLVKTFGKLVAVDDLSFSIEPGICFGLLGPNGAGKTTTIEIIEGIQKPTSGEILYRGKPVGKRLTHEAGIQFQSTSLMDFLTAGEVLKLFAGFYSQTRPLAELIKLCELGDFLDTYATRLSGGQRQRLLLAVALVNDPKILFLDEPTTGLDPQARRNFWRLIENIRAEGKTILLTTHYMEEAELLCDRLVIIDHGKIIVEGPPAQLLKTHFGYRYVCLDRNDFNCDPDQFEEKISLRNGQVILQTRDAGLTIEKILARNISLNSLQVRNPTLDDLFLDLTGYHLDDESQGSEAPPYE